MFNPSFPEATIASREPNSAALSAKEAVTASPAPDQQQHPWQRQQSRLSSQGVRSNSPLLVRAPRSGRARPADRARPLHSRVNRGVRPYGGLWATTLCCSLRTRRADCFSPGVERVMRGPRRGVLATTGTLVRSLSGYAFSPLREGGFPLYRTLPF
jgi:hypothetical protein